MDSHPKQTALLVIDLLQDFFDAKIWPNSLIPGDRSRLAKNTNWLVDYCRRQQMPVIWVKQAFKPDLSDAFPHMRRSKRKYTISGTPGAEILPELNARPQDHILFKSRFSAFFQTDLEQLLQKLEVEQLILAGITTAWCIRTTATDGYQRDYEIIIAEDCTQAFTRADHLQSLQAMNGYIATVLPNKEIHECMV